MAPRIAPELQTADMLVVAGRIVGARDEPACTVLEVMMRDRPRVDFRASHVINCTGPTTDVSLASTPIIADGLARGLLRRDTLGLGIETNACAVIDAEGLASDWLFAIGPLTRPEFWEVTAVPEIMAQSKALAERLSAADATRGYGI